MYGWNTSSKRKQSVATVDQLHLMTTVLSQNIKDASLVYVRSALMTYFIKIYYCDGFVGNLTFPW